MHSHTFFAVASIVTAFCVVCDVRRISEGAVLITVTESILCEVQAEAKKELITDYIMYTALPVSSNPILV